LLGLLALRLVFVTAAVAGITLVGYQLIHVNAATAGFSYLIAVLFIATNWGLTEAIVGSCTAAFCFNFYFLPPVGSLTISDPKNWVALLSFLVTSIVGSELATRAKQRAAEAVAGQQELSRLYALSRSILLADDSDMFAQRAAQQIEEIFQLSAVALYDGSSGRIHRGLSEALSSVDDKIKRAASDGATYSDEPRCITVSPIRLGGRPVGSLAVQGTAISSSAMDALCNLLAIGLDKVRSREVANRAEAVRQSDEIKSTLFDAIAHEFKTPLTSIKAAAGALLSPVAPTLEAQRELAAIVDEEADRLSALVTGAIQMARIEAGGVRLKRQVTSIRELLGVVLQQLTTVLDGRKVLVHIREDLPGACIDRDLIAMAVRQLLENAIKYSKPGTPLVVEAKASEGTILISVIDEGPGIPEYEQSRIFERFYRGLQTRNRVPGTGMGLAIAREILRLHGGDIIVTSREGEGTEFCILVPLNGVGQRPLDKQPPPGS
jgi:two-component system sensor histidine kinase KdpD